ncbi:hypothetical protein, partial [Streptomyces lannensis]|uniref:hypothetical protein n=1 Tax=Streptomyces lannensis TaxID=766498 RepID=UPI0031EF7E64
LTSLADEYTPSTDNILDAFASDEDPTLDVRTSIARSYHRLDPKTPAPIRLTLGTRATAIALG